VPIGMDGQFRRFIVWYLIELLVGEGEQFGEGCVQRLVIFHQAACAVGRELCVDIRLCKHAFRSPADAQIPPHIVGFVFLGKIESRDVELKLAVSTAGLVKQKTDVDAQGIA